MRIFLRIIVFLIMFVAIAEVLDGNIAFFEFIIAIYGGIFLLLLDEALKFLKKKFE